MSNGERDRFESWETYKAEQSVDSLFDGGILLERDLPKLLELESEEAARQYADKQFGGYDFFTAELT